MYSTEEKVRLKGKLEQYSESKKELADLEKRISKLERMNLNYGSVEESSKEIPFQKHIYVLKGCDGKNYRSIIRLKNLYKKLEDKLIKDQVEVEQLVQGISDPRIRRILRYKYYDGLSNVQIIFKLREDDKQDRTTELSMQKELQRFFKKT